MMVMRNMRVVDACSRADEGYACVSLQNCQTQRQRFDFILQATIVRDSLEAVWKQQLAR